MGVKHARSANSNSEGGLKNDHTPLLEQRLSTPHVSFHQLASHFFGMAVAASANHYTHVMCMTVLDSHDCNDQALFQSIHAKVYSAKVLTNNQAFCVYITWFLELPDHPRMAYFYTYTPSFDDSLMSSLVQSIIQDMERRYNIRPSVTLHKRIAAFN